MLELFLLLPFNIQPDKSVNFANIILRQKNFTYQFPMGERLHGLLPRHTHPLGLCQSFGEEW